MSNWNIDNKTKDRNTDTTQVNVDQKLAALEEAKSALDSIRIEAYYKALAANRGGEVRMDTNDVKKDDDGNWGLKFQDSIYESKAEYDSIQKSKPPERRHGWLSRIITYRFIELNQKYSGNKRQFLKDLLDKFIHSFPYLLFVSLPLYALFLKLLYIRRKQFFYVNHGIFLVHLYIFTFIILLILFGLYKLDDVTAWNWIGWVQGALIIYGIFYTIKAMRNFYNQGWLKTITKFILFNFLAFVSLIFLFSLFFILTVFRI